MCGSVKTQSLVQQRFAAATGGGFGSCSRSLCLFGFSKGTSAVSQAVDLVLSVPFSNTIRRTDRLSHLARMGHDHCILPSCVFSAAEARLGMCIHDGGRCTDSTSPGQVP